MTVVLGRIIGPGNFLMVCVDCQEDIVDDHGNGTIDSAGAVRASIAMANKGGVKCPRCREISCDNCGTQTRDTQHKSRMVFEDNPSVWVEAKCCSICALELAQQGLLRHMKFNGKWQRLVYACDFPEFYKNGVQPLQLVIPYLKG